MARFDLTDEEWAVIAPVLSLKGRVPRRKDDRMVLNRIFYVLRTGAPWRDLPDRYGPHNPDLYAMRNLGERFFCRMKDMRRLTMRDDKLKRNYLGMVQLFAIRCWLN